ncbi:MAG TPA: FixH family protein [Nitrospirota bacterium]|nr:FixH family protein [Nitrospirota bacterium]
MKRSCNRLGTLWTFLAEAVLIAGIVGIGALPASTAENGTTCDIQSASCLKETGDGMTVEFDARPKPVAAMSELTFIVNLTRGGLPISDASVVLDLSMPGMFMGRNRPVLKHVYDGRYEGKGIITMCPSGKKAWQAEVTVMHAGKTSVASFVFEVK